MFKSFMSNDMVSSKTLLHEQIPITGTIISGTYDSTGTPQNVKTYSHGMFESVYDYPYLSSSANHILDITCGFSPQSSLSKSSGGATGWDSEASQKKKINIYNEMAQILAGYDSTGSIETFDEDGNILAGGTKIKEAYFVNFSRLLSKDEIKKGSFSMSFLVGSTGSTPATRTQAVTIADTNAQNIYKVNSPAGEYGILKYSAVPAYGDDTYQSVGDPAGLIYYQAGIAVLTASIFRSSSAGTEGCIFMPPSGAASAWRVWQQLSGAAIDANADALRNRITNIQFNNTTELNSTIYFCRANHNEFNYSTNPTYLTGSKIKVKNVSTDNPVAYATTVGLYSPDNELLAVAKLSEPIKKDPTTELTFRVRLDY